MTDKQKMTLNSVVDAGMKLATGIILVIVGLVAESLADLRTDVNELNSSVKVLDTQMREVQQGCARFTDWLEWWHKSVPAIDAAQTTRLNSLEEKICDLSERVKQLPPDLLLEKVQANSDAIKELQRK